jgi:acyl-CoA thioesterase I
MRKLIPIALCLVLVAACSPDTEGESDRDRTQQSQQQDQKVYAAVGASETMGLGADNIRTESWPQVFLDSSLPGYRLVNLGLPGATVEDAVLRELPSLLRAEPDIVTVWLNANDILQGVTVAQYQRDLAILLRAITRTEASQVLVANTPPLDTLPAYQACRPDPPEEGPFCFLGGSLPAPAEMRALVDSYNEVIGSIVDETGATLVDLHSSALEAQERRSDAGLVSGDGLHPSTDGHAAVAETFSAELELP